MHHGRCCASGCFLRGLYARGIEMIKKCKAPTGSKGDEALSAHAEQGNLWIELPGHHSQARTPASSTPRRAITILKKPQSQQSTETNNGQRTLQDLLFTEGLLAFDIRRGQVKGGNRKAFAGSPTGW